MTDNIQPVMTGMTIFVTGSTRGIGRSIAEKLAENGATVGIHGRTREKVEAVCDELNQKQFKSIPVPCDFSKPENAEAAVLDFHRKAGRLDGLVNNAGAGKALAFRALTLDKWRNTFSTNLESAVIASRTAYEIMRKQKYGAIVNIASISAHGPGKWMGADYAASKAGLVSITQSLAFEAARFGIRVNAVSPGMVETDMTAALSQDMIKSLNIPLGRMAKPAEIASVVEFLLSKASNYITGQVIHVNGGLQM